MSNHDTAVGFRDRFEAACVELFQGLDCKVHYADTDEFDASGEPYVRIDAGCHEFELEIYMCLPYTALIMTHPMQDLHNTIPETELEDWLCELCNLLMGKLKRVFFSYGFNLTMGLPDLTIGRPPYPNTSTSREHFVFHFAADNQPFEAGIAVEFHSDNITLAEPVEAQNQVEDGSIEFF